MHILYILIITLDFNLSFNHIKTWENSDNFINNVYENYWTISDNTKYFVKATNDNLGEIYYYKENTTENYANTFQIQLHNKEAMLRIREEIKSECNFLRTYKVNEVIHSFYNCYEKKYLGIIGIGIIRGSDNLYSIINIDPFTN